ncbi:MAG: heat-inducible transcriptional repressor HrcA [Abditibacteriales bacterium]|nr:heat-inducible transcriptional repressor HrcA [Abditibacteriales bacterium]MDW8364281.1 heat-inducible transcriptional repressor HrcA [Abditibacteriales bacterium]
MLQLQPRKKRILQAVVEKYVETAEPIGSHTLVRELNLGISSATVRNDLAELEDMELLTHPYTSAGRVPTDLGYRAYVNDLSPRPLPLMPLSERLRAAALDIERVLENACRMLAQLTNYTAIVLVPTEERDVMKHVQLGNVNEDARRRPHRLLVVLVTSAGHVEHSLFETPTYIAPSRLQRIARFLNAKLKGRTLSSIKNLSFADIADPQEPVDPFAERSFELVKESIRAQADDKVLVEGIVYILNQPEFARVDKARAVLNVLEKPALLTGLMSMPLRQLGITVVIGREHELSPIQETSFIGAPYKMGDQWLGSIGILGPTRMKYNEAMPMVQHMARQLSQCLSEMM